MASGLRAVTILALCACSLILFGWQVSTHGVVSFAHDNSLLYITRKHLLLAFVFASALVAVASASYIAFSPHGLAKVRRISHLIAPFLLLGLVPPLLVPGLWEALPTVITIVAFTVLLERLSRLSFNELSDMSHAGDRPLRTPSSRHARRVGATVAVGCAVLYAVCMSRYTIFNHRRFGTYGYDLGQYDNIFWTTLHGHPFRCSPLGVLTDWHELGGHADLSVFFFLPFYAIRPNAETLLIMQSSILALGAVPLYLFSARRLPAVHACALAICYLLYPPLHGANFYDFHFQPIASTLVLFTIYLVDTRRWIWTAVAYTIAIGCREDTSVGLTILGLYLALTGYRLRAGIIMAVVGATYFVAMRFFIMPYFGPSWFQDIYKDLYPNPDGPHSFAGVIETLATNPMFVFHSLLTQDKLRYFLQIVAPLALLPLRRTFLLPALLPGTIFTLLTTAYPPTIDIAFQYSGHFIPYLFCASALALAAYRSELRPTSKARAGLVALTVGTLLCTLQWGANPVRGSIRGGFSLVTFARPTPAHEQKARDLADLDAMVPASATIAVTEEELPHVSGRLNVLTLRSGLQGAEYVLYGVDSAGASSAVAGLQSGDYQELAKRPGLVLLKRKH